MKRCFVNSIRFPIDQFPKSQNAPVPYPTMLHSEQKCAHFCSEWSIVGYGISAFWNLGNWSIGNLILLIKHLFIEMAQVSFFNSLRPRQDGRHFADIFRYIFLNENVWISINISLKFVPNGQNNNILALVQIMAWGWPGDKPLSEQMMVRLPTNICVTRQWVKSAPPISVIIFVWAESSPLTIFRCSLFHLNT